jgi:hypothetical protein
VSDNLVGAATPDVGGELLAAPANCSLRYNALGFSGSASSVYAGLFFGRRKRRTLRMLGLARSLAGINHPQKKTRSQNAAGLEFSETILKGPSGSSQLSLRRSRCLRRRRRLGSSRRSRSLVVVMMLLWSARSRRRGRWAGVSSLRNDAETENGRQQEDDFLHINKVKSN